MKVTAGRITAVGGLAALASVAFLVPGADAHHPEVSASAVCAEGLAEIRILTASWESDTPGHMHNPDVTVSFGGQVVGRGAFLPSNNYRFTVVHRAPADGRTYVIRATSVAPWGEQGEFGSAGEYRETSVTLPTNCVASTSTTPPTTTTAAPATTTTSGGVTSGTAVTIPETTTTAPAIVGGAVETRPVAAAPIAVQPRFAG